MLLQMLKLKGIRIQRRNLRESIHRMNENGVHERKQWQTAQTYTQCDGTKPFMEHRYHSQTQCQMLSLFQRKAEHVRYILFTMCQFCYYKHVILYINQIYNFKQVFNSNAQTGNNYSSRFVNCHFLFVKLPSSGIINGH